MIRVPTYVILGFCALALAGLTLKECKNPAPVPQPAKKAEIRYILDTVALSAYKAKVEKLEGSALRQEVALRAAARRAQLKLYSPDGTFVRDSGDSSKPQPQACVDEEDLRTMLVSDSTCPVERDSARTALAEESQVVAVLRDSIATIERQRSRARIIFYSKCAAVGVGIVAIWRLVIQ